MRFTLARKPRSSSATSRAFCSASFTLSRSTYSKVRRSRLRSGNSRAAVISFSKSHFFCYRHQLETRFIVGSVQGNSQLGADLLFAEVVNPRHDARSGNRHARNGNADTFWIGQQANRFHEIVVVQKRLALAHEDQIDAFLFHGDAALVQNRDHLAGDLGRSEIALQAK